MLAMAEVEGQAAFRRRLQIYTVSGLQVIGLKTVRASLSSMVPFIVAAGGMHAAEEAMLLSAFFPGYSLSQLLLGGVVQVYGSKAVLGAGLGLTSLLFVAAPALSRLPARALALSAMLFSMGVAQGPMAPANSQLNRAWMPAGQERVWALKAFGLAHQSTNLIAALFTPILCRRSWHVCCYVYGCACAILAVTWQLVAENKPPSATPSAVNKFSDPASVGTKLKSTPKKAIEWNIFRVPSVLVTVVNFVAYGAINYSMMLFAPSFFVNKLGCTPEVAGRYLALVSSVNIPGQVAMGLLESALVRRQVPTVTVRRWSSGLGALLCSTCTVLYALAQTPRQGFFAYLCYQISHLLHEAGQFPNMMEVQHDCMQAFRASADSSALNVFRFQVGGQDTAVLTSVSNSLAQIPAVVVPALGLWLRQRTGSWVPQYVWVAAFQAMTGLLWLRYCSCTPARDQLEKQRIQTEKTGSKWA